MQILERWGRFNLVGLMGAGVQLASLAALARWNPRHYMVDAAAALELTLIHNFLWHRRFTWRVEQGSIDQLRQWLRFQLTSGLTSMTGNLLLLPLLVERLRLRLVLANLGVIALCSVANFALAHLWAFARTPASRAATLPRPTLLRTTSRKHLNLKDVGAPSSLCQGGPEPSNAARVVLPP